MSTKKRVVLRDLTSLSRVEGIRPRKDPMRHATARKVESVIMRWDRLTVKLGHGEQPHDVRRT
jgi:hypothetical protein